MKITFLLFSFLMICSCRTQQLRQPETPVAQQEEPAIVFVVFKISTDTIRHQNNIELVSVTQTTGKLKPELQNNPTFENSLTLDVYDGALLLSTTVIEHPLYKRVEYIDGNTLHTKSIKLLQEEFFVRLQVKGKSRRLTISETLKDHTQTVLKTIQL